jgi:nitroimidazol reductase NimA-like FMN-containing flavoprotein (pyridoxamine 5'-phosphate oxidase superfamily)
MQIREMTNDECLKFLAVKRPGRLACARDDQPYIVPFHFGFDGHNYLYAFSTPGQKIEWMRTNPLVCIEIDDIDHINDWTTIVIFGHYEELLVTGPTSERTKAYDLLSQHPMWWQPGYAAGTHPKQFGESEPIYFRIRITQMTGHRALTEVIQGNQTSEHETKQQGLWNKFWRAKK